VAVAIDNFQLFHRFPLLSTTGTLAVPVLIKALHEHQTAAVQSLAKQGRSRILIAS
jgi:hypothetical protein